MSPERCLEGCSSCCVTSPTAEAAAAAHQQPAHLILLVSLLYPSQAAQGQRQPYFLRSMADIGDIPMLVRRLRSARRLEQAQAAEALSNVAGPAAASVQGMLAAGGYTALVSLLSSTSNQTVRGAAARALLAGWCNAEEGRLVDALEQEIAAAVAGSLPSLLALLDSSLPEAQQAAATALNSFAVHGTDAAAAIMAAGGVPALVRCLRESPFLNARALVAFALSKMCRSDSRLQCAFAAAGAAAALMPLLASSQVRAQRLGAWGLLQLMRNCPEGQQAADAAGAVPALAHMLTDSADEDLRSAAVHALRALSLHRPTTEQQLVGCAPAVVRTLQHSNGADQHAAVGLLACICDHCSQQEWQAIAAAGTQPALEACILAHSQDAEAAPAVAAATDMLRVLASPPAW